MHGEGVGAGVAELAAVEYIDGRMLRVHRGRNVVQEYLLYASS